MYGWRDLRWDDWWSADASDPCGSNLTGPDLDSVRSMLGHRYVVVALCLLWFGAVVSGAIALAASSAVSAMFACVLGISAGVWTATEAATRRSAR